MNENNLYEVSKDITDKIDMQVQSTLVESNFSLLLLIVFCCIKVFEAKVNPLPGLLIFGGFQALIQLIE